ncbi:MAG: family 43 glycosylhydrolase [Bacteroidia bacterium]|nr:family 43 glycosylhydrolase [Bacteroidia bacterium]
MKKINFQPPVFCLLLLISSVSFAQINSKQTTFCNPMNLNYRFQPIAGKGLSYREAADPTMTLYKDKYFLYASHSGGYWYSDNMLEWKFIPIKSLPIEDYAPDVITINDTTYYLGSSAIKKNIYFSTNPFEDKWKPMAETLPFAVWDPHFFRDDDGKVILYWGCSDRVPIKVVQLDSKMQPIAEPKVVVTHNPTENGWENPGEFNEKAKNGYNEGAWINKYNNKYYLQYASPGTEFKVYADGVYTSDSPMGPFKYETYSPFSYKPGGFIAGAGHSSTFEDRYGNYWHAATMTISIRHNFERRLGLFPACFDKDGVLRTLTAFGDYPTIMPNRKIDFEKETLFKGWMLLSYNKKVTASSSMENYPVKNAFDENIRTWWSANSGNAGEWLSVELNDQVTVNAIQVNFADNESILKPETENIRYCYRILASYDQKTWKVIVDKSNNTKDACHDYIELEKPLSTKYIKIENVKVPDGKFSVYDLRIFGKKKGKTPNEVSGFAVVRDASDSRRATVKWTKDNFATGYVVNYGTDVNKLYTSYMVYDSDSVRLTGLNKGVAYYFSVDAFNESGITKSKKKITQ